MLDPDKPLVASSAFAAGDGVVSAGEVFDWRARGMTLVEVAPLYASGLLVHPAETYVEGGSIDSRAPGPQQAAFSKDPSKTVHVPRHGRRR